MNEASSRNRKSAKSLKPDSLISDQTPKEINTYRVAETYLQLGCRSSFWKNFGELGLM